MCCSVMEDLANFTITHDYHNFQGLEFTDRLVITTGLMVKLTSDHTMFSHLNFLIHGGRVSRRCSTTLGLQ